MSCNVHHHEVLEENYVSKRRLSPPQAKGEVKKLIEKAQSNDLEAQPGRTIMESFENQVNQVLNKARDDAGRFAQNSLKDTNNVVRMVTAGSKGSFINISQVGRRGVSSISV